MDYALNKELDIFTNEWGKFVTVEGQAEFEQSVTVDLHDRQSELIGGGFDLPDLRQKIKLIISRLAKEYAVIDAISELSIRRSASADDTLRVSIVYDTGDEFTETI
jgi:hypothetical protein